MPATCEIGNRRESWTLEAQDVRPYVVSKALSYGAMLEGGAERSQPRPLANVEARLADMVHTVDVSPLLTEILPRVHKLIALPENWDSYGSSPPSLTLAVDALVLLRRAEAVLDSRQRHTIPIPSVVPLSGGGIQFEWHLPRKELELEFCPRAPVGVLMNWPGAEFEATLQMSDWDAVGSLLGWLAVP